MAVRAALVLVLLALLCGGCASTSTPHPAVEKPAVMPLTSINVGQVRASVVRAKASAPKPASKDAFVRFARQVYVASWAGVWSAAATTETAMAKAQAGDPLAREYLTVVVYDLQLQAAMEGVGLSAEDWHDIYVGSGIMDDATFSGYAAMSRCGKVLP